MGCRQSKNAVATENVITKSKSKNLANNPPVENVKGNNEITGKTNGVGIPGRGEVVPGEIKVEEVSAKPGVGNTDGVRIPGNEKEKNIEVVTDRPKVEESRTNEVKVTGNEKEKVVPVAEIREEESGKEVSRETGDPGNGEPESGSEIFREGKGKGIQGPGSGESSVKSEALEEKKVKSKNEKTEAANVAAVEEKIDESKNEESAAADVAAEAEKKDEIKNEEDKSKNEESAVEKKDEIKNDELKAENDHKDEIVEDSSSKKDHNSEIVEDVVPDDSGISVNDVPEGKVEGSDAKDGKADNTEDNSVRGKAEETPKVDESKENVTADETKSPAITGADETSATKDDDATTTTTRDAKAN